MPAPRVASLIASSTEIVCALGFADLLVARSHECDYPEFVKTLPQITAPKIDADVSSARIDRQVRDIVRAGLSVYRVDAEALREVDPNVIVTQDHCEVCAVSTKDLEAAVCNWLDSSVRVVSLTPNSLTDIFGDIAKVASALGAPNRAERLIAAMRARIAAVRDRAAAARTQPRVAFIEWIEPLMGGGNWMPELIAAANATDVLGRAGEHSGWIQFEALSDADPDVIIIAPCGLDVPRTLIEMPPLVQHAGWQQLRAVRNGRVFVADGNAYFNRPGPRVVDSVEILGEIIHPEIFRFAEHRHAWRAVA